MMPAKRLALVLRAGQNGQRDPQLDFRCFSRFLDFLSHCFWRELEPFDPVGPGDLLAHRQARQRLL
jgi:hypothetical protein